MFEKTSIKKFNKNKFIAEKIANIKRNLRKSQEKCRAANFYFVVRAALWTTLPYMLSLPLMKKNRLDPSS